MAKKKIANSSLPVLSDFKVWLSTRVKANTASDYCTWLKNIINDIKVLAPNVKLTLSEENYLNVVPALIQSGIFYKAEIVCELLEKHIKEAIRVNSCSSLSNDQSALKAYIRYIKSIIKGGGFSSTLSVPVPDYDALMPYRKELRHYPTNVGNEKFDKINGIDSLIELFGNNHLAFIKKVLSESYFLSPDLEKDRFNELINELKLVSHARYSNDYKSQCPSMHKDQIIKNSKLTPLKYTAKDGSGYYDVELDDDGNRFVRDYIHGKTNYWISKGKKDSHFIGFKISHIWGQAIDPRFFSSFWNIVIVPSWANDLLDKDSSAASLIGEMIGTFKAVCIKLYDMKGKNWSLIRLSHMPNLLPNESIIHSDYQINIINEIQPGWKYGQISTQIVPV